MEHFHPDGLYVYNVIYNERRAREKKFKTHKSRTVWNFRDQKLYSNGIHAPGI